MMRLYRSLLRQYRPAAFATTRRNFLALGIAAATMGLDTAARAQPETNRRPRHGRRVIVVGAGFAGLACADELRRAGYDVHVLEARSRVGGRVLTLRDWMPGKVVEAGGELIGSNHPTWIRYARRFGLHLRPVTDETESARPVLIDNRLLTESEKRSLFQDLDRVLATLTAQSASVNAERPWLTTNAEELDKAGFGQWLAEQNPQRLSARAIEVEFAADNGVDIKRQSLLGMMSQVKGGGLEAYWTDTETHRCREGNDMLATMLARSIGIRNISLGTPVSSIGYDQNTAIVTDARGRRLTADHVVLTVPPSVWNKITFDPPISPDRVPQMGINYKFLSRIRNEVWKPATPDALTDGIISETWDGTDGQAGTERCLVGFAGGPAAGRGALAYGTNGEAAFVDFITSVFPRMPQNFVQGRFIDWPNDPWVMAGYSSAAPGEITRIGHVLHGGIGRLQFAGEYCCYAFAGYMEGALQSALRAVNNIISMGV